MVWVTLPEIALALGVGERSAARRARQGNWSGSEAAMDGRKLKVYAVEALPLAVRRALVRSLAGAADLSLDGGEAGATGAGECARRRRGRSQTLKDWQWDVFMARVEIYREFERLRAENGTNGAVAAILSTVEQNLYPVTFKQLFVLANARRGKRRTVSRSTLLGMQRAVRREGIAGLVPKLPPQRGAKGRR